MMRSKKKSRRKRMSPTGRSGYTFQMVSGGSESALEGAFEFLLLKFNDIKLGLIDELGLKPLFQALGFI